MHTIAHKPRQLISAVTFLAALGNVKRLEVLYFLSKNEIAVGQLAEMTGLSQSALSQHLAKLRTNGLVKTRRVGQSVFYTCDNASVHQMLDLIDTLFSESGRRGRHR